MNSIVTKKMKICRLHHKNTIIIKVKIKKVLVKAKVQVQLKILHKRELSFWFPMILFNKSNSIKIPKVISIKKIPKNFQAET